MSGQPPEDARPEGAPAQDVPPDETTRRLKPGSGFGPALDDYSATVLDGPWNSPRMPTLRWEPEEYSATLPDADRPPADPDPAPAPTVLDAPRTAAAADGVLRFGPGVPRRTATPRGDRSTAVWHGDAPGPDQLRRRRLRRAWYALVAAALLAAFALLAWQRIGPGLAVEAVSVRTEANTPGCDRTADVVGLVKTNGRRGTITYRWLRSDGSTSGRLAEKVTRGQREARLHLQWTFRGEGRIEARADLEILSPGHRTAGTGVTYACAR